MFVTQKKRIWDDVSNQVLHGMAHIFGLLESEPLLRYLLADKPKEIRDNTFHTTGLSLRRDCL